MAKPCPECHADYVGKCPYCGMKLPGLPDWEDLRGIAPDATGDLSSEDFIRKIRDEWRD